MKHLFFLLLFAITIPLKAQVAETTAIRLYRVGDQLVRAEADGSNQASYPYENVYVRAANNLIQVSISTIGTYYYTPSLFLNDQGIPYGSTVNSAMNAYLLNIPGVSGTGGSGTAVTTNASSLTAGTLDDSRLSENVVKTTGSYTNPAWISALDPTRITQTSLNRFVSDAEKTSWNSKPDLAQVQQAIKDSARTFTFLNAAVATSGNSTTVTIPTAQTLSVTVDNALNATSTNPLTNAAVTNAIEQVNASIATNTTGIASNSANIGALQTQLTATVNQVTADIATNAAGLAQANASIATNTTAIATLNSGTVDDSRLSANVVKTTGSYANPAWISALDPTRITQTSLNRFVSDAEKTTWNSKPDLAQVKQTIKDSLRTYTFLNAAVAANGNSFTVTIPTPGEASVTVDNALNASSTNPLTNAAITTNFNQVNTNIATNTAAINQANANIAANTAATATNTANIATNTAGITALQTQLTAATGTLSSGTIDDARLSANVVKTTGSYANPGWISALDPTRITQTTLYRFVSDTEKSLWNSKTDLSQVRLAIKDSVRAITFVNASVTSSGNSLTVTIPTVSSGGGGSSMTVDNALNTSSTNPLTNAAIAAAFNQVNTNIATNTTGLANATNAINQTNANVTNLSTTVAANTATITSNAASVTALQSQLTVAMAQVASLSALVGQLQEQLAISTGTYTISTPALTASILSNSSILLTWAAVTNATSYTLESATNSSFTANLALLSTVNGTTYTVTGLTAGVTYYFRIRASGGANTAASGYGTVAATISAAQLVLDTPTNVAAWSLSASSLAVSWTGAPNATSYSVRYATNSSMTSATTITTSVSNATITDLQPGTSYFVDVSASASGYTTSAISAIATATTSAVAPTLATPTNIVASPQSASSIAVSWTASPNATSYTIRYATNSNMTSATTVTSATNSVTLSGLPPSTFFFIDVSASASGYTTSATGSTTGRTNDVPPTLATPTNVVASAVGPFAISASWTASASATSYSVRYATNSDMTSATTVTSSATSLTISGLLPVTTYFVDVSAKASGFTTSAPSATATATTNDVPPTLPTPTNVVASPLSTSTIAISWTASTSATSYSVRYATNSAMTSATTVTSSSTSLTLTGLTSSTTYFVDVSASASGFTTSATSATATARTNDVPLTLPTPTNVVASAISVSAITVSWTGSTSATSYTIRYATNSSMTSATTVNSATTSLTLTGLTPSTTYFVTVSASASGFTTSATSATATARTNDVPTLPTPTNVVASTLTTSAITVSWTGSTSATSYSVRYATNSAMTSATTVTSATTSLTLAGLTTATSYFVDVSASAPGYITSATSATATAKTLGLLAAPTNVVATALGGSAISVTWTASTNATSYSVRYALTSDMSSATTTTTSSTSITINGLTTLTTYFVDVSASATGFVTSATSATASTTTTSAFVAERTFRLSFQTSSAGSAIVTTPPQTWNQIKPSSAQLTAATSSFTSTALLTETGASSLVYLSLESPYTQATAASISATTGSVYVQAAMQSAWQVSSTNTAGGKYSITGLTPGKYYQLYFLSASSLANTKGSYTINGVVKTFNAGGNAGVGGGDEFAPNSALVTYYNVQPDANGKITVLNKYVSGSASPFNTCVIRESSVMFVP